MALNGDIIDSLAEDEVRGYVALDGGTAVRMMERIYEDASFAPVWNALADFVQQPKRHLIFIVGNHDIELHFPGAQERFVNRVAPAGAAERVRFVTASDTYYLPEGIQVRHGHQLEAIHRFDYKNMFVEGRGGKKILNLPWGSLWILEVLNPMKQERHHLDHIVVTPRCCHIVDAHAQRAGAPREAVQRFNDLAARLGLRTRRHGILEIAKSPELATRVALMPVAIAGARPWIVWNPYVSM